MSTERLAHNVLRSYFFSNSPKLNTTQISIKRWMDKHVANPYNGSLFSTAVRNMDYLYTRQHVWTSKALCWVKEARHKMLHPFTLTSTAGKASRPVIAGDGGRRCLAAEAPVSFLGIGGGYPGFTSVSSQWTLSTLELSVLYYRWNFPPWSQFFKC